MIKVIFWIGDAPRIDMLVFYVNPRCIIAFTPNFKKELRHLRKLALSYGLSLLPAHRLEVTEIVIHFAFGTST